MLGIPMGFGITIKQRWAWALDRIKQKIERWSKGMFSLAGRVLIINKFIIPSVIYFLACWRPPDSELKIFCALCRNFLWVGDCTDFRIPKVKWDVCTLHKDKGGLGITDPMELANRLASKWVVRSILHPEELWAKLLHRHIDKAKLVGHRRWRNLPHITLFCTAWPVSPIGSQLVKSIWKAWNQIKGITVIHANKEARSILAHDSIWWPLPGRTPTSREDLDRARHLHNLGIRVWQDLWDHSTNQWIGADELQDHLNLEEEDIQLITVRLATIQEHERWMVGLREQLSLKGVGWLLTKPLFPIPQMERAPPIHVKLNEKWNTLYDRKQWYFKFTKLWSSVIPPKFSTHLWLIMHQGLWTGAKARRIGIGDGLCKRCRLETETLHHLFLTCRHNTLILDMLNNIMRAANKREVTWQQRATAGGQHRLFHSHVEYHTGECSLAYMAAEKCSGIQIPPPRFYLT